MHPFRMQDVPGQQFRFPEERGSYSRRPAPPEEPRPGPSPPGSASRGVGDGGRGVAIGTTLRQDPRPAEPRRGSRRQAPRDPLGHPCDHARTSPPVGGCPALPAAPPQLRAFPRGSTEPPTFRHVGPGPACSLARSGAPQLGRCVRKAPGLARILEGRSRGWEGGAGQLRE